MATVRIDTPLNVPIDFPVAGLTDRIFGRVIDTIVFLTYVLLMAAILMAATEGKPHPILPFIIFAPAFFYSPLMETAFNGQTLGKMAVGTRVVRLDGSMPTLSHYFIRWIFLLLEFHPFGASAPFAVFTIAASGAGQRIGDIAAGTSVVSLKTVNKFRQSFMREIRDQAYTPVFSEVAYLSDRDLNIIDTAYRQARRTNNRKLLKALVGKLLETLRIEKSDARLTEMGPAQFVRVVIKDYNYFTGKV